MSVPTQKTTVYLDPDDYRQLKSLAAARGAIAALIDADDRHHEALRSLYERSPESWVLPWAILPEVDYLLARRVGRAAEEAFLADLASGVFALEGHGAADLVRARKLDARHRD